MTSRKSKYDNINLDVILNFYQQEYIKHNKKIPNYSILKYYPQDSFERIIFFYFMYKSGGIKEYCNFLKDNGLDVKNFVYIDPNKNVLKSLNEFIFTCFCHYNNISYQYEPIKIQNRIPDFYLPDLDIFIEIVGFGENDIKYSKRGKEYCEKMVDKKIIYINNNIKAEYIQMSSKNQIDDIYNVLIKHFNYLSKPDITEYYQKYCFGGDEYINSIKILLNEFYYKKTVSLTTLREKHSKIYRFLITNYTTLENAIEKLLNVKTIIRKKVKSEYWFSHENCINTLDAIKKVYPILPNRGVAAKDSVFGNTLTAIYNTYTDNEFRIGGIFHGYVDYYKEKQIKQEKVIQISTNTLFNNIREAFENSNICNYNEFVGKLNSKYPIIGFDFKYYSKKILYIDKIQNIITGEIYNSIVECAEKESLCKDALGRYLANVKIRNITIKSKFNYLKPLTYKGKQIV